MEEGTYYDEKARMKEWGREVEEEGGMRLVKIIHRGKRVRGQRREGRGTGVRRRGGWEEIREKRG